MPEDVLGGLEKGTGENEGKVKLSFKYPDLFPTLKFATNANTRRKVFVENENKVSVGIALGRCHELTTLAQREHSPVSRVHPPAR